MRTNETWCKLSRFKITTNTCDWSDSQEHMISLLELKFFLPLIMITLLYVMWCFHILLNRLYILDSLLNNLMSKYNTFARIIPTQRCHTPSTIKSLKRCHSNARMKFFVVSKLSWNLDVNLGSRFEIMVKGIPCKLTIFLIYTSASFCNV